MTLDFDVSNWKSLPNNIVLKDGTGTKIEFFRELNTQEDNIIKIDINITRKPAKKDGKSRSIKVKFFLAFLFYILITESSTHLKFDFNIEYTNAVRNSVLKFQKFAESLGKKIEIVNYCTNVKEKIRKSIIWNYSNKENWSFNPRKDASYIYLIQIKNLIMKNMQNIEENNIYVEARAPDGSKPDIVIFHKNKRIIIELERNKSWFPNSNKVVSLNKKITQYFWAFGNIINSLIVGTHGIIVIYGIHNKIHQLEDFLILGLNKLNKSNNFKCIILPNDELHENDLINIINQLKSFID
ncbi:MAG: hypothetical protein ACTSVV_03690 [Promethearchaeota archaeon]